MKKKTIAAITGMVLLAAFMSGCLMDINEIPRPVTIVTPYITEQPKSQPLFAGDSATGLSVTVGEWKASDGALSYQWFKFNTPFDFITSNFTELLDANSDTYVPGAANNDTLNTTPVGRNYYFVEVTNTNKKVTSGKDTASAVSEVAVVSFNTAGQPAMPVITRQPADGSARFGRPVTPLSVRASIEYVVDPLPKGELFYQWYKLDLNSEGKPVDADNDGIPDATAIDGETKPTYTPSPPDLGDWMYYVEVAHAIGRTEAVEDDPLTPEDETAPFDPGVFSTEISVPATVNIRKGLRALAPIITAQPKAALYFDGDAVVPLKVEAQSEDNGTLSYQWYSNTVSTTSGDGRTRIEGATEAAYTPSQASNKNFYYVVVTNTNENVEGSRTASVTSRPVNVRWAAASTETGNATVQVYPNRKVFNYIRGYGGMEVAWANFPETSPADTELQYDPDRLGFNILRIMLPVTSTNIDEAMEKLVSERRQYYYDNVKIVNKYGGYVAAAPWTPPKEWKSNNSINGGGHLRHEYYQQYADYLKSFARHMGNRGAPIYCISIQNEPNYTAGYDGCEWENTEMRDFFKTVGSFTEGVRGWGGGVQTPRVLTMNGESANDPGINYVSINDSKAYAAIDLFGRHVYGDRRMNIWAGRTNLASPGPLSQANREKVRKSFANDSGKDVWMTEHNINSANATAYPNDSTWHYIWRYMNDVDLVMRLNNENGFVWWASKRFYSMIGDGQYGTPDGVALPRGYGLSHYSKYTIGATRVDINVTGNTGDGAPISYQKAADDQDADGNTVVNGTAGDMDNTTARITAYAWFDKDDPDPAERKITDISLVMWQPTKTDGQNVRNMGKIRIEMPANTVAPLGYYRIKGATGIQSYRFDSKTNRYHENYNPGVSADRRSAFVDLPNSRIISVKFQLEFVEE